MSDPDEAWRRRERFTVHPETVEGEISREFVDLVLHIHPDQDYSSAEAALLCRQAYDLAKREAAGLATKRPDPDKPHGRFVR